MQFQLTHSYVQKEQTTNHHNVYEGGREGGDLGGKDGGLKVFCFKIACAGGREELNCYNMTPMVFFRRDDVGIICSCKRDCLRGTGRLTHAWSQFA